MNILLNCFPPADISMPDLGLSVLKKYLNEKEVKCDIMYWNILLYNFSKDIIPVNTSNDIVGIFLPYLVNYNHEVTDKLQLYLQYKNPGWTVMDINYYKKYLLEASKKIHRFISKTILKKNLATDYSLIGISYKFSQWIPGILFIREMKKINPSLKTLIGGIPSRVEAVKFLETFSDDIDYAIWGEGEIALHQLVSFLAQNKDKSDQFPIEVQSLAYMKHGSIVSNLCKTEYSELVVPDYSDFMSQYNIKGGVPMLNMENSRGCYWNKCKFCYLNEGYKFRRKTSEQLIKDLDYIIKEYKVKRIFFNDNDLCGTNMEKFEHLLDSLIAFNSKKDISFIVAEFNSKKLNKNLIRKASLAGFRMFQIGVESVSDRKLKKIDKHASFVNHLLAFKFCYKYGIMVTGSNLIKGFIDDDLQDVTESVANIHYLRFYFKLGLTLRLIDLCIKNTSKYFDQIKPEDLPKLYSELGFLIDDEKILKNRFYFFEHINPENKAFWLYFENVLKFYHFNKFSYRIDRQKIDDVDYYVYTEFLNDDQIANLTFDKQDWSVIEECSNEIHTLDSLIINIRQKEPEITSRTIKSIVKSLIGEKLIYMNQSTGELFCIIDTEVFEKVN